MASPAPGERDGGEVGEAPANGAGFEELNARLAEEVQHLRQALAARDNFLAVAAHELRNPMTPILGRVTLLRRLHRRGAPDLRAVDARLEALETLIVAFIKRATVLLDVSRAASASIQVEREPVLASLLRDACGLRTDGFNHVLERVDRVAKRPRANDLLPGRRDIFETERADAMQLAHGALEYDGDFRAKRRDGGHQ